MRDLNVTESQRLPQRTIDHSHLTMDVDSIIRKATMEEFKTSTRDPINNPHGRERRGVR
jgi:hypothetical protein